MSGLPSHLGHEILRVEVGSTLHGTGLDGHEDHDEMGVFLEWPRTTIGLGHVEHYVWRSAEEGQRSQPHDTDLVLYSLRKWTRLALMGNPSVLLVLFAQGDKVLHTTPIGDELRSHADWFASKRAGKAFLGYMEQQRQRMVGERGRAGRVRVMPDGGVDWKYAMHMLRLGYQGKEYLTTGHLTVPMPTIEREQLRLVRQGLVDFGTVIGWAERLEVEVKELLDGASPLPDRPNIEAVEAWVISQHLDLWREGE
jgi:predicted nucleotidyltransferase